jgi:hypothetical protein
MEVNPYESPRWPSEPRKSKAIDASKLGPVEWAMFIFGFTGATIIAIASILASN